MGTVLPGETVEVDFTDQVVDPLSCNVATVTCDIRGATGENGPKPPLPECRSAEKQTLSIRAVGTSKWKWKKGTATTKADFGDPTADTDYEVCLYYSGFGAGKRTACSNVPAGVGWKESKNGFSFKSKSDTDGVSGIKLKAGESGKATIKVKKSDERVLFPLTASVFVQISNSEGECWESGFTDFDKNNVNKFDAK